MDAKTHVVVVCGGKSTEHEVSLKSAASILQALDPHKYHVSVVGINKAGHWLSGPPVLEALQTQTALTESVTQSSEEIATLVSATHPYTTTQSPVLFPVLHGPMGEDGTIQGLLELAQCPYVGSGVLGSSLGMDKVKQKELFQAHAIPVVKYVWFWHHEWEKQQKVVLERIHKTLGNRFPVFVKPVNAGSSVGITKVHKREELFSAIDTAFLFDTKIMIEEGITGVREIEVGVLGNYEPSVSVCGEIIPSHEFYDYQAKYADNTTKLVIPATIEEQVSKEIRSYALQAFRTLECWGLARVDFFYQHQTGDIYLNELNTMPGFTSMSMYPKLWEATGISYGDLVDTLITLAKERFEERSILKTSP